MPTSKDAADPFELDLVRALAAVLEETGLSEIEVDRAGLRVRVARRIEAAQVIAQSAPPLPNSPAGAAAPAPPAEPQGEVIRSPMVGTVYLQPQPDAAAFAKVGDQITEGQTLLLIEAMKTMNPITAPRAGRLAQILVGDGQPVEYGEALAVLE
ncbi:MAG: acetyl-CoA carboxylase biotin carboxyl carrier protein [Caulobacteraceae bacterium]